MRRKRLILLRSDKSVGTACWGARAVLLVLSRCAVESCRERVAVESRLPDAPCNSRFRAPPELLLNRLIYCRSRGVYGRQVQQGAVFPRWKMPDDRRRHGCLSLPARLHGRSLRDSGGPAGNRINFEGINKHERFIGRYTVERPY